MLFGVAACAGTQAQNADHLRQALDALRAENGVAAVGLVIVNADEVMLADAWGIADRASSRPADAASRFRIGSITKTFTGLLALRLRARGALALEQPVAATLGPLAPQNPWRSTDPITLAQLLEHSAGLEDMGKAEFDHSEPRQPPLAETLARHAAGRCVFR